ncbi:oxygenase MpaB family protein [Tsukamurella ocularis]|uniref:oxygenase MpaB family protein n=1 Tax=Tsukamurella ocularis TaxID=1970234 RepID=UPI0039EE4EF0
MSRSHRPTENDAGDAPLTLERTRIRVPGTHRRYTSRDLAVTDALDFWGFAGAAANVAMQMMNPGVGHGVVESTVESGALMKRPWKRARTTTQYLAVAILGSEAEKEAYREAVDVVHRQVKSKPGAAVKYNAFDRDLQLWVAACLFVGFEDAYQLLNGKLPANQAESFYQSCATLGTTLQVPRDMWPATRADFDEYWLRACAETSLDEPVAAYLDDLLNLRMINRPLRFAFGGLLKFLTAGSLAPYFREQMGVRWTAADQRRFDNLFVFVGFVNRFIPRFLRFGPTRSLMVDLRLRIGAGKPLV